MTIRGIMPKRVLVVILAVTATIIRRTLCLNNGLARTPPMGWLSWQRFLCNVDCDNDPTNCISERLFKDMADRLVQDGYRDLGYEYVNMDDCWMNKTRDPDGKLQPDRMRFPNGIKALADYVHGLGLKLGIYQNVGEKTCAGYPGALGHFQVDAQTYADWGVDMVKLDACNIDPMALNNLFPQMSAALNGTGRPMIFSCNWPYDQMKKNIQPNYTLISQYCNMWRNYYDISDSWKTVTAVVDYYTSVQGTIVPVAGPGQWNDPDMLVIGNFGLSLDQAKTQMALWAIYAAPLLMSNDLRDIREEFKVILQNKEIIGVNQDPMGQMGKWLFKENRVHFFSRPVTPVVNGYSSFAVAMVNRRETGGPVVVKTRLSSLNLTSPYGYHVRDLYTGRDLGLFLPSDDLRVSVNPTGVVFVRADVYDPFNPVASQTSRAPFLDVITNGNEFLLMCLICWCYFLYIGICFNKRT